MKLLKKNILYPIFLTIFTAVLLSIMVPNGMLFGSDGDWYTQHVAIAEQFRQMFYETGDLFGQFSSLGSGSSMYDFAYYGFLRPDVLFSYLVPDLDMKYIISGYAVLCILASVNLCFFWLKKQKIALPFCAAGSILLLSATCFFQAHRQIMFINYMPFLLLALYGVDRLTERENPAGEGLKGKLCSWCHRTGLLTGALCLFYIHSFYFSVSGLFVVFIYFLYKSKRPRPLGAFLLSIGLSIGMACILLLPVGLNILSNEKDAGAAATLSEILSLRPGFEFLLYSPYGCGLTLLVIYCLLLCLTSRKTRTLSIVLLLCPLWSVIPYLLNATLYVRAKSLMPLVPLFLLLTAKTLEELFTKEKKPFLWPALLCFVPAIFSDWRPLILVDGFLIICWLLALKWAPRSKPASYACCLSALAAPVLISFYVGQTEEYLSLDDTRQIYSARSGDEEAASFSQQELLAFCQDNRYRFDCLTNGLTNSNCLVSGGIQRTTMYSSTTNSLYAHFFYDTIKNPISIRNRVALLPNSNCFFSYLMGVRYIQTIPGKVPYGYEVKAEREKYVLAENTNTLPMAYGTGELLSEKAYDELSFPHTLEALTTKTVVTSDKNIASGGFTSHIQEENPSELLESYDAVSKDDLAKLQSDQGLLLNSKGEQTLKLPLAQPLSDRVLILNFQVESPENTEVSISINSIRNKLSGENAPYPNNHHDFTYIISSNEVIENLKIILPKGTYRIRQLRIYSMDLAYLNHKDITEFEFFEAKGDQVLNGTIQMEKSGYFVTSIPFRKGYEAFVDGERIEPEVVNTAFVGFPIREGTHRIQLKYHAPGRTLGAAISLISLLGFVFVIIIERRKHR